MTNQQNQKPYICNAVRAIGFIKPKFDPKNQNFTPPALDIIGSAFLLKEFRVIVTCEHVVRNFVSSPIELSGMLVVGREGNYSPVTIDTVDFVHDLAILRYQQNPNVGQEQFNSFVEKEFSSGLELVEDYSDVSTEVAYTGFPLGSHLLDQKHNSTYSEGVISIKKRKDGLRKQIQISGPIINGFSGAPIVLKDDQTKLIGMISNSPSKEAGDANIFMAISWEHIKAISKLINS